MIYACLDKHKTQAQAVINRLLKHPARTSQVQCDDSLNTSQNSEGVTTFAVAGTAHLRLGSALLGHMLGAAQPDSSRYIGRRPCKPSSLRATSKAHSAPKPWPNSTMGTSAGVRAAAAFAAAVAMRATRSIEGSSPRVPRPGNCTVRTRSQSGRPEPQRSNAETGEQPTGGKHSRCTCVSCRAGGMLSNQGRTKAPGCCSGRKCCRKEDATCGQRHNRHSSTIGARGLLKTLCNAAGDADHD